MEYTPNVSGVKPLRAVKRETRKAGGVEPYGLRVQSYSESKSGGAFLDFAHIEIWENAVSTVNQLQHELRYHRLSYSASE